MCVVMKVTTRYIVDIFVRLAYGRPALKMPFALYMQYMIKSHFLMENLGFALYMGSSITRRYTVL